MHPNKLFDHKSHRVELHRLESRSGIKGHGYLISRIVANVYLYLKEAHLLIPFSMVYRSFLAQILYVLHTSPEGTIARKHDTHFPFHAKNSQIYRSFDSNLPGHLNATRLEACITDVNNNFQID